MEKEGPGKGRGLSLNAAQGKENCWRENESSKSQERKRPRGLLEGGKRQAGDQVINENQKRLGCKLGRSPDGRRAEDWLQVRRSKELTQEETRGGHKA